MSLTNFPNGIFASVVVTPQTEMSSGKVFFVGNSTTLPADGFPGSNGSDGLSPQTPFSTLAYAISRCVAGRGDIIYLLPGHVETITEAGGITINKSGISVVGLGQGELRPKINFTTVVGADLNIDAANVRIQNVIFTGGIDALTGPLDVNAADFSLINCEYRDVTGQATDFLVSDANANRMLINGFAYRGDSAAGTNSAIVLNGADDVVLKNILMDGNFAVSGIDVRTAPVTDLQVSDVKFRTRNAADLFLKDTITGSTGMIGPNIYIRLQDNAANITEAITGATFVVFDDVYVVNNAGEKGMLINWTASTDA